VAWLRTLTLAMLTLSSSLTGCVPGGHQPVHPHYVLGPAWKAGGTWFYPAVEPSYDATGLAIVEPPSPGRRSVADGEAYDPAKLTGAHQTLPLPAVVDVIDLETGHSILLRINDRGPASAGRLLAVTPAAARLLGMRPDRPARVRVILDAARTQALQATAEGAPQPDIVAAPLEPVSEQQLDGPASRAPTASPTPAGEDRLPRSTDNSDHPVRQLAVNPGRLWVEIGRFSSKRSAVDLARRVGATVDTDRQQAFAFSVLFGPFDRVVEADRALDRAQAAGLTGARIIVQ